MKTTASDLVEEYQAVISNYLAGAEALALDEAYSLGRRILSEGAVQFVTAHHQALQALVEQAAGPHAIERTIEAAAIIMTECMAVVEMALRGYQEANVRLSAEITQHKQTQAELRRAYEAAQAATQAKSQFLANMSHEIRTPLNAVIGMTELVLKSSLQPAQREYLVTVRDSGEALLSVINDILDFSRIEAGKLTLDPRPFDLRESLGDTLKSFALRAHQQGLELAASIQADVPPVVVGDYNRLRQIIVNLVGNALKFTLQGEVLLEVRRAAGPQPDVGLQFTVSDTGVGIPQDKQAAIFQMFEQVDNSLTRRHGGTGLGLAIAARLVEMMGGRLWVESAVGRGSRFHFTAHFGLGPAAAPSAAAPPAALAGLPMLVVDDNATNRRILDETLRGWDVLPAAVASVPEATARLEQAHAAGRPFRLILTDAHMPDADGFALAAWIKGHPQLGGTAVMMLTSADHPEDPRRYQELGITAHLLKPVKESELRAAIEAALGVTPSAAAPPAAVPPSPAVRPLRILLAEDSLVNQQLAIALLQEHAHQVTAVNNGHAALAALEHDAFDLVLMDVQMPELDGLATTARIRAAEEGTGHHLPIIAMTAHALSEDRQRCLQAGMDGYLAKPIHGDELLAAVEALVGQAAWPPPLTAPRDPSAGVPAIDWAEAGRLLRNNRKLITTLVTAAVAELPQQVDVIRQAAHHGNAMELRLAAHTLKGSLRYFGPGVAYQRACDLEQRGAQGQIAELGPLLDDLEAGVAQVTSELREFLTRAETTRGEP